MADDKRKKGKGDTTPIERCTPKPGEGDPTTQSGGGPITNPPPPPK